jgi:hypothetical protein
VVTKNIGNWSFDDKKINDDEKKWQPKKVVIKNFLLWLLITTKCMMIEKSPILIAFIFTLGSWI